MHAALSLALRSPPGSAAGCTWRSAQRGSQGRRKRAHAPDAPGTPRHHALFRWCPAPASRVMAAWKRPGVNPDLATLPRRVRGERRAIARLPRLDRTLKIVDFRCVPTARCCRARRRTGTLCDARSADVADSCLAPEPRRASGRTCRWPGVNCCRLFPPRVPLPDPRPQPENAPGLWADTASIATICAARGCSCRRVDTRRSDARTAPDISATPRQPGDHMFRTFRDRCAPA